MNTNIKNKTLSREDINLLKVMEKEFNIDKVLVCFSKFLIPGTNLAATKLNLFVQLYEYSDTFELEKKLYTSIMNDKKINRYDKSLVTNYFSYKALILGHQDIFFSKEEILRNEKNFDIYLLRKARYLIYTKDLDKAHSIIERLYYKEKNDDTLQAYSMLCSTRNNYTDAKKYIEKYEKKNSDSYYRNLLFLALKFNDFEAAYNLSNHLLNTWVGLDNKRLCIINYELANMLEKKYMFDELEKSENMTLDKDTKIKNNLIHILKHTRENNPVCFSKSFDIKSELSNLVLRASNSKPYKNSTADNYLFETGDNVGTVHGISTSKVCLITKVNSTNLEDVITAYPSISFYNSNNILTKNSYLLKKHFSKKLK